MQEGRGEIVIDVDAPLPPGGTDRQLTMENCHQRQIAVYLVNALVPTDPAIRIAEQTRNSAQSYYRLDFAQDTAASEPVVGSSWSGVPTLIAGVLLLLTVPATVALQRRRALRRPLLSEMAGWRGMADAMLRARQPGQDGDHAVTDVLRSTLERFVSRGRRF